MKRFWLLSAFLAVIIGALFCQQIIENPERPSASNAGRVVSLQPVLSIADSGDDYYLTNPMRIRMGRDGSIFVLDMDKMLRFNREGRFVRDYKIPADNLFLFGLDVTEDRLIVFDRRETKVYVLGWDGKVEQSFSVAGSRQIDFLFGRDDRLYFLDRNGESLFSLSKDGEDRREVARLASGQKAESEGPVRRVITAPAHAVASPDGTLWISNQSEYLIHRLDAGDGRIDKSFRRHYERVELAAPAPQKYKNDIADFIRRDDCLWAITSTFDPEKGDLVDVYDFEGRYIDNFYFRFSDATEVTSIGFLPKDVLGGEMVFLQRKGTEVVIRKCALKSEAPRG